jgi:hypothetical protein
VGHFGFELDVFRDTPTGNQFGPPSTSFSRAERLHPSGVRLRSARYAHLRSASPRRGEDGWKKDNLQKHFYTPKAAKINEVSEPIRTVPNPSEGVEQNQAPEGDSALARELEKEIMDLKITNRGKDFFIEQLQKERDGFFNEVIKANRKLGELETRLLQLGEGKSSSDTG